MSTAEKGRGLRRELRFWETIALSIGIMAPTAAMALNGVGVAANVGRAVPLAMIIATIGVLLVSFAFVRLAGHYAHAGSVYAFSGATLGPRAGFFSGWALLGTYLAFTVASTCEVGLFFPAFLNGAGIWSGTEWIWVSLIAAGLIWGLAYGDVKVVTRVLLSIEGISITLIVILMIVIFLKLAGVHASARSGLLDRRVQPAERCHALGARPGHRAGVPLVRRLRGRGRPRRGDREPAA